MTPISQALACNTLLAWAALLNGGFARAYDGGKRGSWCG
jgi:hypothetical protein